MRSIKATSYVQEFYVRGNGVFPFDMLRYDQCWPAGSDDAYKVGMTRDDPDYFKLRTIKLVRYAPVNVGPTSARWSSFMWACSMEDNWPRVTITEMKEQQ